MDFSLRLLVLSWLYLETLGDFDGRWPRQILPTTGLCRFGSRVDCCWGWARHAWGHCQPFYILRQRIARIRCQPKAVCQPGCKHGECIGPNKCKCHPGYTGKICNQAAHLFATSPHWSSEPSFFTTAEDHATYLPWRGEDNPFISDLNECGLKPRPCKHRCMNTYGSYKCYCLNGYMLMPDGSCSNALTCSMANCQYGCDVVKGEIHCRCPSPGLQLAPDGRTCIDVDECITGSVTCPRFRKCVNTFGSYICKCHKGFDLMYIGGRYQCHGIPKVMIDPSNPYSVFKSNSTFLKGSNGMNNRIPESGGTRYPIQLPYIPYANTPKSYVKTTGRPTVKPTYKPYTRLATQPATTRPAFRPVTRSPPVTNPPQQPTVLFKPVTTTAAATTTRTTTMPKVVTQEPLPFPSETTPQPGPTVNNWIPIEPQKPRGDVFIPRQPGVSNHLLETFEIEQGISANEDEANDDPGLLIHSCNFDGGLCRWIKERNDDLHWEPVKDSSGGQYLSISQPKGKAGRFARLVLPLGHLARSEDLCLSFRHKVSGLHSGLLQVFLRKTGIHGPAIWGRNRGHGWSQTHITLKGPGIKSVIFKGEKGKGRTGEIGLDDISLRKGRCSQDH
ncbi:nephronectin isoform X5 [Thamnophis elegans]|uniref:nephronectin isoform X5 n=1 Tax=Thamnophis elegans TaxID=35005 RepID=UPI001378D05F|nr:nephronectin isoform X5 [Thamnophis elegans]